VLSHIVLIIPGFRYLVKRIQIQKFILTGPQIIGIFLREVFTLKDATGDEYRSTLVSLLEKAEEQYARTVLYLSGGALAVTFAFVDKVAVVESTACARTILLCAWLAWGFSTTVIALSPLSSRESLIKAIHQFDTQTITSDNRGGIWTKATVALNLAGAVLFITGIIYGFP
jgi:hypothetical protein